MWDSYQDVKSAQSRNLRIEQLNGVIDRLDEVLTMSARMAAVTADPQWEARYLRFEPELDAAIQEAQRLGSTTDADLGAAQTDAANVALVEMEHRALELARTGQAAAAASLLSSPEYAEQKVVYAEGSRRTHEAVGASSEAAVASARRQWITAISAEGALLLVTIALVVLLSANIARRSRAEASLMQLNRTLEGHVSERTLELSESEERYRALYEEAPVAYFSVDIDGIVRSANRGTSELLGYAMSELVGRPVADLYAVGRSGNGDGATIPKQSLRDGHDVSRDEVEMRHATGTTVWVSLSTGTVRNPDGAVTGSRSTALDISERKRAEDALTHHAFHDALTDLPNRALFRDRLEHALERRVRHSREVGVLFLDLDNFKAVNDGLGHAAGDTLLIEVGRRLRACTRLEDTVARLGGDEFAVLIEEVTGTTEAVAAAQRILSALRPPVRLDGREIVVPASIGIAVSAGDADAGILLRNSDVAMYAAKALGKNRHELYQPSMHAVALDRLELAGDLEGAVDRGEFVLEYQPVVTLATSGIAGVEALVRWNHPGRGRIEPDGFIPLAEETGAIIGLGRWVLREACRQARAWRDEFGEDSPFSMNVNVSACQLRDADFLSDVAGALAEWQLEPASLVLEVTESVMMRDTKASLGALRQLKDLGVRLAIDDFGTGYSSLSYVRQFPFDILKIDRSFLTAGRQPASDDDLERAIVELGRTLKLEIVAEGVERIEQLALLNSFDCELGQGFYFARPMPPDGIRDVLRARRVDVDAA